LTTSAPSRVPLSFAITASPGPLLGARDPEGNDALESLARDGVNQVRLPRILHDELAGLTPGQLGHASLPATLQAVQDQLDWAQRASAAVGKRITVAVNLGDLAALEPGSHLARWLDYVVERFKDHPALGVWKFYDEPNNPYIPHEKMVRVREGLRRGHARVHELDGKHLTWITHAPKPKGRISERFFRTYVDACDVLALDLYPISDPPGKHADIPNKLPSGVGDYADRLAGAARAATAAGNPKWVWMVLQGAGWSGVIPRDERGRYIGPSVMQPAAFMFRYMVYQSIIHGAQGIVVFGMNVGLYQDVHPYGWDWGYWRHAVVPVLRELRSPGLAGALAAQQPATAQRHALGPRGVRIDTLAVREPEGAQFLLASRSERKRGEPREAEVALPLAGPLEPDGSRRPTAGSVEVLFEDRHALVQRGAIEDRFAPHEVHVYRLSA
jgi:hypothetical protein